CGGPWQSSAGGTSTTTGACPRADDGTTAPTARDIAVTAMRTRRRIRCSPCSRASIGGGRRWSVAADDAHHH
ncbi:MAG: hypothetical protein AVDCRST_MAG19-4434, partial [uncultured Thermomicrobiales bacterium]